MCTELPAIKILNPLALMFCTTHLCFRTLSIKIVFKFVCQTLMIDCFRQWKPSKKWFYLPNTSYQLLIHGGELNKKTICFLSLSSVSKLYLFFLLWPYKSIRYFLTCHFISILLKNMTMILILILIQNV